MKHSTSLQRLAGMVAADTFPTLSNDELHELLQLARVPDKDLNVVEDVVEWEPHTTYVEGDRVTDRDGYAYVATSEGTSGADEPTWGATATDGTVAWVRDGNSDWRPTYDLNLAAAEGWLRKMAKVTDAINFQADNSRFDRSQYLANCQTMHDMYASRINASVRMKRSTKRYARVVRL